MSFLRCQLEPYCKELETTVVSCEPSGDGYEAVLEETILYPEGGGQPSDFGEVGGQTVRGLRKTEDDKVAHLLDFPVEGRVTVRLDWRRRYDHMQQHTGQHLLTAVAQSRFGWATTAFHLGAAHSDVELDAANVTSAELEKLEIELNDLIRRNLAVSYSYVERDEMDSLDIRTRGLPEGMSGKVRLVEIEGVDLNTCGGTHAAHLSEVQAIKLIGMEKLRGGTRVFYLAGGRVLDYMRDALDREKEFNKLLSCPPPEHVRVVQKALDEAKSWQKASRNLMQELAGHEGRALAASAQGKVVLYVRNDAAMDFLRSVVQAACKGDPELVVLAMGASSGEGQFLLGGPEALVNEVGTQVAEVLGGRGGGARGIFQGKATRLQEGERAVELIKRQRS